MLKWTPVAGAAHYIIAIDGVKRMQVQAPAASVDLVGQPTFRTLPPGAHHVTITAVDKKGVVGKTSAPVSLAVGVPAPQRIAPAPAPQLAAPASVTVS
jgi:hypothetical protein